MKCVHALKEGKKDLTFFFIHNDHRNVTKRANKQVKSFITSHRNKRTERTKNKKSDLLIERTMNVFLIDMHSFSIDET